MSKNRSVLNSPRLTELKKKKKKNIRNKILIALLGIVVIVIGLAYISRLPKLNIQTINISGNKVLDTEDIEKAVHLDIDGKYLWLFPKTNFLLFPRNKVDRNLHTTFTRATDITVKLKTTQTLDITLAERAAAYTWCGETVPVDITTCYFMDSSGYIFDTAPYFSGNVYFKFFGKTTSETDTPLGAYFNKERFQSYIALRDTFTALGLKISSLLVKGDGDAEFYLSPRVTSSNGPRIMFKTNDDFNKLAENLQAALATEPFHTDFTKKYSDLLYIDLRFGNKVYYKFANQAAPVTTPN